VIRVAIVDDQEVVRVGLAAILSSADDIEVVLEGETGHDAVAAARTRIDLDVMMMDIRMPGLDGLAATGLIRDLRPELAVIVLTTFGEDDYVIRALAAGASGFLLKRASRTELIGAVRAAAAGDAVLSPEVTRLVVRRSLESAERATAEQDGPPPELATLTRKELEILRALGTGANNGEIGAAMHLSESTIKSHVSSVLRKLGCRDRVQAALLAVRLGLLDTPN
jgi:DNA-binding NarL/FixJ family response regulator